MIEFILKKSTDWFLDFPKNNYRTVSGLVFVYAIIFILIFSLLKNFLNCFISRPEHQLSYFLLYIALLLILIWTFIWIEIRDIVKKNKTNKPGIGFFVNSTIISGKDLEKDKFIKILSQKLDHKYTILFYDKYEYNILQKKIKGNLNQMKLLNLKVQFIIEEENGNLNGENSYNFILKETFFLFNSKKNTLINKTNLQDMRQEFEFLFKRNFCITKNNNLDDSKTIANILNLSISYIYTSIVCATSNAELGLKELSEIELTLTGEKIPSDIHEHIRRRLSEKYIICYENIIDTLLDDVLYFLSKEKICRIISLNNELFKHANIGLKNFPTKKRYFDSVIEKYKSINAICLYDLGDTKNALEQIHKFDWTNMNNVKANLLNKSFLLIMSGDYQKGIMFYSKVRKKIDINSKDDKDLIDEVQKFIDSRKLQFPNKNLEICGRIINSFLKNDNNANEEHINMDIYEDLIN